MSFNPLKEKGTDIDKQLRSWKNIASRYYDKREIDCYSRCRQILMNGIEVESWNFLHNFLRNSDDIELNKKIAHMRRIEDQQQTTINWLMPWDQTVLETTLGYEQVAVDLTAYLAQNEPDPYVKETYDFGLLEDFDHLYRYSQWGKIVEDLDPNKVIQMQTDVFLSRPTQNHHNDNALRLRRPYDKLSASPITKVNIMTLVAGEQQTHNYYKEHGMMYANMKLRKTFAEIGDVEEEHVTMYESLIDPSESMLEKFLLHEFCEVCNYYSCYEDEKDELLKPIWEMFLSYELSHLQFVAKLFEKEEKRDPEEIIGNKVVKTHHFESNKKYVEDVLRNEIDKRLSSEDFEFTTIDKLPEDWPSYEVQEIVNEEGSPTEQVIRIIHSSAKRDIVFADEGLIEDEVSLLERGLQPEAQAPNTVTPEELQEIIDEAE